ncbi:MAG: GxxExxY protein [Candidatus Azobacteroides sp.]|nr:GxxExxY protein [Candidatus Azobacteroides sp.]
MLLDEILTEKILSCAYTVHSELGPGLLEKVYEECLYYELKQNAKLVI